MKLFPTVGNPAPDQASCIALKTADGHRLRAMTACVANPRGTVVILGGRGDFLERYFETMRDFMAQGYSVASLDVRGQGGSQAPHSGHLQGGAHNKPARITNFESYDEDVRAFANQIMLPECSPPYFLLGHSTGGNIALRIMAQHRWFDKCVVTSPLLGLPYAVPEMVLRATAELACLGLLSALPLPLRRARASRRFENNPFTQDYGRWQRDHHIMAEVPDILSPGPYFGWLRAALKSMAELRKLGVKNKFNAQVLAVLAGRDRIVDNEAIHRFSRQGAGMAIVTIPEARHEILLETDMVRAQFFAAFDAFVSDKTSY